MKTFYTYMHCKPDGTPFYVGKGALKRCYEFGRGRRGLHHQNIVAKHGQENIQVLIFKKDSEESAFKSEIRLIKMLRNAGFELCNKTDGGEGSSGCKFTRSPEWRANHSAKMKGRKASAETKMKMSVARVGRKMPDGFGESLSIRNIGNQYGIGNKNAAGRKQTDAEKAIRGAAIKAQWATRTKRKHTPETIAKISAGNLGKKRTNETRAKISASLIGNKHTIGNQNSLGHKHSAESIAKMSVAKLGKKHAEKEIII